MIAIDDIRRFLSYQRYSALAAVLGAGCAYGLHLQIARPLLSGWSRWPVAALLALAAIACLRFAWFIASSYSRKLRATHLALRRIEQGRFQSKSLQRYCEDPCYRVVAKEILRHTELDRVEQAAVFRNLVAKSREPAFLIFVDPSAEQGVSVQCEL